MRRALYTTVMLLLIIATALTFNGKLAPVVPGVLQVQAHNDDNHNNNDNHHDDNNHDDNHHDDDNHQAPTATPTPTVAPTATPTPALDCDGDTDGSTPNDDDEDCTTPTVTTAPVAPTATPTPTVAPTATPTQTPPSNNGGGSNGGDGRSDGLSSCPQCTQAPQGSNDGNHAVLGASTTQAVLGASTMASTGTFETTMMNAMLLFGMMVLAGGALSYAKEKKI